MDTEPDSMGIQSETMNGESRQLVTDEPVEVQDCRKITDRFRGIYRVYLNLIKENWRISTCNRLDLQILGSQPIMPKNLSNHWYEIVVYPYKGLFTLVPGKFLGIVGQDPS